MAPTSPAPSGWVLPPEEAERVYAVVDEARRAGIAAARPGVPCESVDRAARAVIEQAGYGAAFLHRTGHGVGLEIHEPPYMVGGNATPLATGNVHSVEPGIYLAGRFGVRLEDLVAIEAGGARRLNDAPFAPRAPAGPRMTVETRAVAHGSEAILEDLNQRQREAVTHGEGPLLIVAGAGTGKTQVITRRIAWLIAEKRARPDEILALTFTEKAAAEMESRVDDAGALRLYRRHHRHVPRVRRPPGAELRHRAGHHHPPARVCTEAEVRVFLREHLFDLGLQRFAPLGQPDRHLAALVKLFSRARDEDVSPEEYLAYAERLSREAQD